VDEQAFKEIAAVGLGSDRCGSRCATDWRRDAPTACRHAQQPNSLDWSGTYEGVLPSADCPGTKTRLTLNPDGSYRLVTQAQGSQNAEKSVSGVFTWQPSENAITLDERAGRQQFSVGEGRLTLLRPESDASQSPEANLVLTLATPHSSDLEQQLLRYRWTLVFATDANNRRIAGLPPGRDHPVVLSFAGSRLSVQGRATGSSPGIRSLLPTGSLSSAARPPGWPAIRP
jgi:uncharacterized lipoprotein NlpE involved in copper resistance